MLFIHKSVVDFDLEKEKLFRPGEMYTKLSRVKITPLQKRKSSNDLRDITAGDSNYDLLKLLQNKFLNISTDNVQMVNKPTLHLDL